MLPLRTILVISFCLTFYLTQNYDHYLGSSDCHLHMCHIYDVTPYYTHGMHIVHGAFSFWRIHTGLQLGQWDQVEWICVASCVCVCVCVCVSVCLSLSFSLFLSLSLSLSVCVCVCVCVFIYSLLLPLDSSIPSYSSLYF